MCDIRGPSRDIFFYDLAIFLTYINKTSNLRPIHSPPPESFKKGRKLLVQTAVKRREGAGNSEG